MKINNLIKSAGYIQSMVGLKKGLIIGISGLALLSNISLRSQEQKFQEENSKNKIINYPIEDSIKVYESEFIVAKRKEFVENAREYLGEGYLWGGRLTKENPGLDCLGLIFLPYAKTFNKKWTEISTYPGIIIKKYQLGKPVEGLDGILNKDIDISRLEEGDIIHLLNQRGPIDENDIPSKIINGIKYWTWHTGIYSNKEKNLFLHANPRAYPRDEIKVTEYDLKEILKENEAINPGAEAIFVTRIY